MYYGNEKKVSIGNYENLIAKAVQQYSNYHNNGYEQQFQGVPIWWSRQSLELKVLGENLLEYTLVSS